jgi:MerT mercuric transport protein
MKSSSLTFASIIAAIAASLCCLGPTIAVLVGVGTFGLASVFESARPYLLAVAGALLVIAFYRTYRVRRQPKLVVLGHAPFLSVDKKRCYGSGLASLFCLLRILITRGLYGLRGKALKDYRIRRRPHELTLLFAPHRCTSKACFAAGARPRSNLPCRMSMVFAIFLLISRKRQRL